MAFVSSKLPYSGFNILDFTEKENPKFKAFEETGIRRGEALARNSVSQSNLFSSTYGEFKDVGFGDLMYANVQNDKGSRLQDYRSMAAFAEVSNALDEICDEMINRDSNNNVMNLRVRNVNLDPVDYEQLQLEFQKYVQFYDFENKGWSYFRDLLTEGELYFEHIIHKDYMDQGVLGVIRVPTELIDPVFNNIQNMIIKGYLYRKPVFDAKNPKKKIEEKMIPMQENQVSYINSGIWNQNKTVRLPFIENARRAYRQLSLIEDSIVIYRLVRAPERLVFNVDVGNMAPPKAEAYLRKLIQQYWSSKTFDVDQNDVVKKFKPQSMLDSFWFAKRAGSEGTSVTQLPGGCLAMDTVVPLMDGRKLTLTEMAAEYQAGKQNWAYSCDPVTGAVVPGLVSWAGVTQKSAEVMELTFDNGKTLICTPDHKFPIIGKGKTEAKDIVVGDSVIPFNTRLHPVNKTDKKAAKYHQVYQNDTKEWEFTHKMTRKFMDSKGEVETFRFDESQDGELFQVIHHKDVNRLNNNPDNLVWMNKKDHTAYHAALSPRVALKKIKETDPERYAEIVERQYKKVSERAKERCNTKEWKKKMGDVSHNKWLEPGYKESRIAKHLARWKDPILAEKYKDNMRCHYTPEALKALIDVVRDTGIIKQRFLLQHLNNRDSKFYKQFRADNPNELIWGGKINLPTIKALVRANGYKGFVQFRREMMQFNHRIVGVRKLDQPIEVGTLTIDQAEKYHNYHTFAIDSEVFTYNSNLGELADLFFFVKKLYEALKVPVNRMDPASQTSDGSVTLREELKFARFVIRMQQLFASGIKRGFITHLNFKGLWKKWELKDYYLDVEFNPPTNYYELRQSQRMELKVTNFNNLGSNPTVSPTYLQKKILQWTDLDIKVNREYLRKDKEFEWELNQVSQYGPYWKLAITGGQAGGAEGAPGGEGGAAPGGGAGPGGAPPAFGGGPAALETPPEAEGPPGAGAAPGEAPAPQPTPQQ